MNLPIDTTDNGCAFALRVGYDAKCYAGNVGTGGGHFPATSVCVVYQLCGRMRDNGSRAQYGFRRVLPDFHTAMQGRMDFD